MFAFKRMHANEEKKLLDAMRNAYLCFKTNESTKKTMYNKTIMPIVDKF